MKLFRLVIAIVLFLSCTNKDKENKEIHQPNAIKEAVSTSAEKISVKTYQTETKEWGYDIYMNGALYIHQPNIPAVQGNRGFRSEQAAKTTGTFVIYKVSNNIVPPTISVAELDSLGVLK